MTYCCHGLTETWNKCDIVLVYKLDIMGYLEQFGDPLLPWNKCDIVSVHKLDIMGYLEQFGDPLLP